MKKDYFETQTERAEKLNGRVAMLGVIAAIGAYAVTGQSFQVSFNNNGGPTR